MDGNLRVKRILSFLSGLALVLLWPIGRMPAWAQLLTLGIGGVVASAILTPPSLTPQLSASFDSNIPNGYSNNGLKVNGGGAAGSMELPSTITNSWFLTAEGTVDAFLPQSSAQNEYVLGTTVLELVGANNGPGMFRSFLQYPGTSWSWWRGTGGITAQSTPVTLTTGGSGYNSGIFSWTATGGNCVREPSGVWVPGTGALISFTDPGAGCTAAPVVTPATIPGAGAQQAVATGATSCVSNSPIAGEMTVTTTVPIAHGLYPAQTFPLSGFTGAGNTGYNATYTALAGTTGTTLVGETTTGGGTCPANSPDTSGGLALSGVGASVTIPAYTVTPFATDWTAGIIAKHNDHFCAVVGEYGADSPTPGVQFVHMVTRDGAAYPGAPSIPPTRQPRRGQFQRLRHHRGARHRLDLRGDLRRVGDDGHRLGDGLGACGRADHYRAFGRAGNKDLLARHWLGRFRHLQYVDEQFALVIDDLHVAYLRAGDHRDLDELGLDHRRDVVERQQRHGDLHGGRELGAARHGFHRLRREPKRL